jgi:hypothetical protein
MKKVKLVDFIKIKIDPTVADLDSNTKIKILDSATTGDEATRGLIVTFDLSNSGRRINNRIYPPAGQLAGVKSWTEPFAKPILMNHDKQGDAIGRFVSVDYVPLDTEAINHLGSIHSFLEVKTAFDSGKAKKIYSTLDKFNLLTDEKWPGVGKLVAKARITDPEAIKKFLDGRFLTFSAGSHTNSYTCLACDSAWHNGDICEHRPGARDEDGLMGIFMTGNFYGDEGSVVNDPANVYSQVRHLEFDDSVDVSAISANIWESSEASISMTDSIISVAKTKKNTQNNLEDNKMLKQLMEMNVRDVAKALYDNKLDYNLVDALDGATQLERAWLIRIHDALHHEHDWRLRNYDGDTSSDDGQIPTDVFKLHGALHEISMTQEFRDALANGSLDEFNSIGESSEEYVAARLQSNEDSSELVNLLNGIKDMLVDIKDSKIKAEEINESQDDSDKSADISQEDTSAPEGQLQEASQEDSEEVQEEEVQEEVNTNEEIAVPWGLLNMALDSALGEHALDSTNREKLDDKFFCGPDRSFPVVSKEAIVVARALIDSAGLSSAQKEIVLAIICEKESMLNDESLSEISISEDSKKLEDLQQDYAQALTQVENLTSKLALVLDAYAKIHEEDFLTVDDNERLEKMTQWFDNHQIALSSEDTSISIPAADSESAEASMTVADVKAVSNPSVASSQDKKDTKQLSDFEQKIVDNYKKIADTNGEDVADRYFYQQRRYLPKTFDLTNHLN